MQCMASLPHRKKMVINLILLALFISLPACLYAEKTEGDVQNRIASVVNEKDGVRITTEVPLGDGYTVYDALDPFRIVVDFADMGIGNLKSEIPVFDGPVVNIKPSTFQLATGQMGRVEIILQTPVKYEVRPFANGLKIILLQDSISDADSLSSVEDVAVRSFSDTTVVQDDFAAKVLGDVDIDAEKVVFLADGAIGKVKHFALPDPYRLVVDLYDVDAGFSEKAFDMFGAFSRIRVGYYPQKLRFVFDAAGNELPEYSIEKEGNTLVVSWNQNDAIDVSMATGKPSTGADKLEKNQVLGDVHITNVDFVVKKNQSILTIGLSGPADIVQPLAKGDIIQFGIKRAWIDRQYRRSIDPSVFPTSVRLITPYTIRKNGNREVRFAVEMKEMQAYELRQEENALLLIIENGNFTEPLSMGDEYKVVPVQASMDKSEEKDRPEISTPERMNAEVGVNPVPLTVDSNTINIEREKQYVGEKISLVFDEADIHNILQLIGEVSDLNIIVGDDVKGTITLRLVDVPWDQALDLVLEIKELGKLQEGNVLRILPLAKIRQMQQERFAAARAKEKLEDLVTDLVPVSYTDVESLVDSCEKRLSNRGKIIGDVRDKKLIITDIPSVVAEIKQLVKLLDTPVRQVLIEARIVEASATFSRDLGVNWGLSYQDNPGSDVDGNDASIGMGGTLIGVPVSPGEVSSGLVSGLTFGQVGVDKAVLDLRLAALEQSGHGRVISTPRVATLNGEEAEVAQGTEIPYLSTSDEGTKTEFKKAELSLKVTPEINPDGSVILEIEAKNDSRGADTGLAEAPAIDTKRATTRVLVQDGETTVIGGIFIQDKGESNSGVPWLMNLPVLGHLFKSKSVSEERRELLVFITPRILD